MRFSWRPNKKSHSIGAFTLIELLVVIAIIALLMAILLPALSRAREQGKRAVCLQHLKQLMVSWHMYCDDNSEKVPWTFLYAATADSSVSWRDGPPAYGPTWVMWPHQWDPPPCVWQKNRQISAAQYISSAQAKEEDWKHAIWEGSLWKYVKEYKIYACPVGEKGEWLTYNGVPSMGGCQQNNCSTYWGGPASPVIKFRSSIKNSASRIVFMDNGYASTGHWDAIVNVQEKWMWDIPPNRHGDGATMSFADSHAAYKKYVNKNTSQLTYALLPSKGTEYARCNADFYWFQKAIYGSTINPGETWKTSTSCSSGSRYSDVSP